MTESTADARAATRTYSLLGDEVDNEQGDLYPLVLSNTIPALHEFRKLFVPEETKAQHMWRVLNLCPDMPPFIAANFKYTDEAISMLCGLSPRQSNYLAAGYALEQYKRSVITEAVTKGLNPDVEMKDSGIEWVGNVPDHWGVLANKYVMKKRKDICTKWNGENVLSLTMNGVIVRDLDNPVGKMPTTFDGYQFVYSGNLLMCLFDYDVTPRCVGIVKNAGVTSPAYSRFELKENATLEYFYYYYLMIDFTKELLHLAKNLRHSFTEEQLGALKVPLPPLDEQKNIATYLDSKCKEIESVIASKKQQLEVLDSYKKSLIYEYVTGKKEVPMYES